jgi:hypothetical protein
MKKVKTILTASSFALALVLSFAFRPSTTKFSNAFAKNALGQCVAATCDGGPHNCTVGGLQGYTNSACVTIAKMP